MPIKILSDEECEKLHDKIMNTDGMKILVETDEGRQIMKWLERKHKRESPKRHFGWVPTY